MLPFSLVSCVCCSLLCKAIGVRYLLTLFLFLNSQPNTVRVTDHCSHRIAIVLTTAVVEAREEEAAAAQEAVDTQTTPPAKTAGEKTVTPMTCGDPTVTEQMEVQRPLREMNSTTIRDCSIPTLCRFG